MYDNNAVYNFSTFEKQKERESRVFEFPGKEKIRQKRYNSKLKLCRRYLAMLFGSAFLIGGFLFGQVRLMECDSVLSAKAAKLEELKMENERAQRNIESENAASDVLNGESGKCVETVTISAVDKAKLN